MRQKNATKKAQSAHTSSPCKAILHARNHKRKSFSVSNTIQLLYGLPEDTGKQYTFYATPLFPSLSFIFLSPVD